MRSRGATSTFSRAWSCAGRDERSPPPRFDCPMELLASATDFSFEIAAGSDFHCRRHQMGSKSKSNKLVCRYCGSDDLAPSFIKRRDRRCRKCFSKRYGSAARASKAKIKK
jgi:hypothetical protein